MKPNRFSQKVTDAMVGVSFSLGLVFATWQPMPMKVGVAVLAICLIHLGWIIWRETP